MKKTFSSALIILMLMIFAVPAYAMDASCDGGSSIISPSFTSISSLSSNLSIDSSGKATCSGTVTPSNNTYTANMTISLQKSTSSGWSTIKTWSSSGTGLKGVSINNTYYVVSGTYRVCNTSKIYNSSGTLLETESLYSATKTY